MTVIDEALTAFEEVNLLQEKIETLNQEIASRTDYQSSQYANLLHLHFEANERLNLIDAANSRAESEKVLLGLGFSHADFKRKISEFSSGWQMRVPFVPGDGAQELERMALAAARPTGDELDGAPPTFDEGGEVLLPPEVGEEFDAHRELAEELLAVRDLPLAQLGDRGLQVVRRFHICLLVLRRT